MEYIPIAISFAALSISILTFVKKQKSDQFRIALETNDKLEQIANRMIEIQILPQKSEEEKSRFVIARRSNTLENLNTFEFFSFLINNKEITNEKIKEYFAPTLIEETEKAFQDYPDIANNSSRFEQLRTLLQKLKKAERNTLPK